MIAKRSIAVAALFLFIAAIALAGDPPPLSPSEIPGIVLPATGQAAGWFWSFVAAPEAVTVILGLISAVAGYLVRRSWIIKWRMEKAVQCLAAGVRETYEEYVRITQLSHSDGKLTMEERDVAMRMALDKAKQYALSRGFDLAKAYAKEFLPVIVERLIGVQKANGRGLPFAPPPPELEPR